MKLLHVIASLNPKGGGPSEGVHQLAIQLTSLGHTVDIVCLDVEGEPYHQRFAGTVIALGPAMLRYRMAPKLVPWLSRNAHRYDAVIVNGLWQYHAFGAWRALRRTGVPYFVFTHGMLDPWFKKAYPLKHLKKWLYWPWADYRVLRDARAVLFTCEEERQLARKSFWLYRAKEEVTSYGAGDAPSNGDELANGFLSSFPELRGKRLALYLSRIHEKKGCDLLIKAFARVAAEHPDLHLVMAGPDQSGWSNELKSLAERCGIADRISWPGMLSGDMKWGAFYSADVFCLPSHQENFGIVVAEALACGKPVLISDKVNIWREIAADGAGIVSPDTLDGTWEGMKRWLSMTPDEFALMQLAARRSFDSRFRIERVAADLLGILSKHLQSPRIIERSVAEVGL